MGAIRCGRRQIRTLTWASSDVSAGKEPLGHARRPTFVYVRSALALVLAPWVVACGEAQGADPRPHPDVLAAEADVRLVDEGQADLVLFASNQSFDEELVRMTIAVDGVTVVDGEFHVEGQHNWVSFPLSLSPGDHEITAESDTGAVLDESFHVPESKTRYAVIDHWGDASQAELTWLFRRQPVAFG